MFQFPTGWNSTDIDAELVYECEFQFPTGWNSTNVLRRGFEYCGSFNSQRDGILLIGNIYENPKLCFNSQRDGILRRWGISCGYEILKFQFPTGWNSTLKDGEKKITCVCFNSQRDGILLLYPVLEIHLLCFNSQRDGILQS